MSRFGSTSVHLASGQKYRRRNQKRSGVCEPASCRSLEQGPSQPRSTAHEPYLSRHLARFVLGEFEPSRSRPTTADSLISQKKPRLSSIKRLVDYYSNAETEVRPGRGHNGPAHIDLSVMRTGEWPIDDARACSDLSATIQNETFCASVAPRRVRPDRSLGGQAKRAQRKRRQVGGTTDAVQRCGPMQNRDERRCAIASFRSLIASKLQAELSFDRERMKPAESFVRRPRCGQRRAQRAQFVPFIGQGIIQAVGTRSFGGSSQSKSVTVG